MDADEAQTSEWNYKCLRGFFHHPKNGVLKLL